MRRIHKRPVHRGIATVEAAVLLPVLVLMIFGFVEIGYLVNSHQVLHDAARQGARAAVRLENSNAEVHAAATQSLNDSIAVNSGDVTVTMEKLNSVGTVNYQIQNLNENEQGESIRITVTVDYSHFHPPSNFLGIANRPLSSSAVMKRQN